MTVQHPEVGDSKVRVVDASEQTSTEDNPRLDMRRRASADNDILREPISNGGEDEKGTLGSSTRSLGHYA